jgi:hypothetical protein
LKLSSASCAKSLLLYGARSSETAAEKSSRLKSATSDRLLPFRASLITSSTIDATAASAAMNIPLARAKNDPPKSFYHAAEERQTSPGA